MPLHTKPSPTLPLRAVIFDMDGTLVDSERVIMHAWLSAAQQAGQIEITVIAGPVPGAPAGSEA